MNYHEGLRKEIDEIRVEIRKVENKIRKEKRANKLKEAIENEYKKRFGRNYNHYFPIKYYPNTSKNYFNYWDGLRWINITPEDCGVYIINACQFIRPREEIIKGLSIHEMDILVYLNKFPLVRDIYIGHAKKIKYRLRAHLGTGKCHSEALSPSAFPGRHNYEKELVEVGYLYMGDPQCSYEQLEEELINMDKSELEELMKNSPSNRFSYFNDVPIRMILNKKDNYKNTTIHKCCHNSRNECCFCGSKRDITTYSFSKFNKNKLVDLNEEIAFCAPYLFRLNHRLCPECIKNPSYQIIHKHSKEKLKSK